MVQREVHIAAHDVVQVEAGTRSARRCHARSLHAHNQVASHCCARAVLARLLARNPHRSIACVCVRVRLCVADAFSVPHLTSQTSAKPPLRSAPRAKRSSSQRPRRAVTSPQSQRCRRRLSTRSTTARSRQPPPKNSRRNSLARSRRSTRGYRQATTQPLRNTHVEQTTTINQSQRKVSI